MTPEVCRAARALAGMTQRELAASADVSAQTIADFERGARNPHANNIKAIRRTFEIKGILFVEEGDRIVALDFRNMSSTIDDSQTS